MHLFRSGTVLSLILLAVGVIPASHAQASAFMPESHTLSHRIAAAPARTPRPQTSPTPRASSAPGATHTFHQQATPGPTSTPVPQTLVVTTTADIAPCPNGPGKPGFSLRCAIGFANGLHSGRTINFAIPSSDSGCRPTQVGGQTVSVCTLQLTRALTVAASSTIIDGYTQAGATPNTSATTGSRDNAVITIQLDGSQSFGGALAISAANDVTIRGVSITNFHTGPAISASTANRFTVTGSFIGVAPSGAVEGNGGGIALTSIHTATIGGSAPADRNLIRNSAGNGISLTDYADGVTIEGNIIADNGRSGVQVGAYGPGAIPAVIQRNEIFANKTLGIDVAPLDSHNCSILLRTMVTFTPCPVIHKATTTAVSGTACNECVIEVFIATGEADDRGFGEGKMYLGRAVARGGKWTLKLRAGRFNPKRQEVTATATTAGASPATSEFALNMPPRFKFRSLLARYSTLRGKVTAVRVTWHMANQIGVAGFNVYAGRRKLNQPTIHVDPSAQYSFAARLAGRPASGVNLTVVLENGLQSKVALHPKG